MPIYTADIAGQPTVVFAALSEIHALDFINDTFIRSELCGLRTPDGTPLWDRKAEIAIRPAGANERTVWERTLFEDLAAGVHESREDAIRGNGFAFLIDYLEPDE